MTRLLLSLLAMLSGLAIQAVPMQARVTRVCQSAPDAVAVAATAQPAARAIVHIAATPSPAPIDRRIAVGMGTPNVAAALNLYAGIDRARE